jgi:peroxin-7
MPSYKTAFNGYSVEYSPFEEEKIAVATSQHFGIIGNGFSFLLKIFRKTICS